MFLTATTDVINEPIASLASKLIEALKTGSLTAILGMVIVFAVLAVIFAALVIMRKIISKKSAPAPKADAAKSAPAPTAVEQEAPAAQDETAGEDDGAIVAAIIAAICAHTGKSANGFRVVSFKRRR